MDKATQHKRIWKYLTTHKRGMTKIDGFRMNPPITKVDTRIAEMIAIGVPIKSIWIDTKEKKKAYKRWFI